MIPEKCVLNGLLRLLLPTSFERRRFFLSLLSRGRKFCQTFPLWDVEPCFHQAPLTIPHLTKTWCWVVVKTLHHCCCDQRMALLHHSDAVCSTGKWTASLPFTALAKPMPPNLYGNDASVWDNSNGSTDINCTMHCQTLASWCSANERVKSCLTVRNQNSPVLPHTSTEAATLIGDLPQPGFE